MANNFDFIFNDHSPEFLAELDIKARTALEAIAIHAEGEAKEELENSPRRIDTGLLRNSITHAMSGEAPAISSYHADRPDKTGGIPSGTYSGAMPEEDDNAPAMYIGTNVEYAKYVHDGTSRMSPNRFLKNACARNKDQFKAFIINALKGN